MHISVRLQQNGVGAIAVNGHDISNAVTGLTIGAGPGQAPYVQMTLRGVVDLTTPARIELPPETVQALQTLGWTPPTDHAPGGTPASPGGTP